MAPMIVQHFDAMVAANPDMSLPVVAIKALIQFSKESQATTFAELFNNLEDASEILKSLPSHTISMMAGCDLYMRLVKETMTKETFEKTKEDFFRRSDTLVSTCVASRKEAAHNGAKFIRDDTVILIHSYSRVVMEMLKNASNKTLIKVIVTEAKPSESGKRAVEELRKLNIRAALVNDSAVGYIIEKVDMVLVGAEAVVQNGGLINQIGTYQIAVVAKATNKPFYVVAESFKFARLFPLNQDDLPIDSPMYFTDEEDHGKYMVSNPKIDYTPPTHISLIFTDVGVLTPSGVSEQLKWFRLKATATQLERVDGRKQWVKHADNLDRAVSDGRTDLVFAAARAMSGNSSRSVAVTPLYNSNGIVQYDPKSILRVMQCHYGSLAADTTGHSLDLQYWHDHQPIQVFRDTLTIRNSDILDQDFSWNQIAAALLQMSPRKAPGDDGITTAFYQAALYMPANTQEGVPPTPFARALLRVCGQVFASATIPRAWLCASIVSIDKKDGDPFNPGDKRGIALINVGLKLVCKVLQMRIERFVETNNLLPYKQAGFRKHEECVGQVVSLVDIIQRRQNAGLNTHVLFIDIRKAFDTVPVGALLWKLQNMGFPCRTLAFLKALYTSSSARARAGSLLSDPFLVQRGVRQGCPLSGLLFNLFINDILDGVAPITVPGLPRDTNPIRGLMYADDVAVFADSEQSLLAASTAIEQWANQWEMQFGVAKCGIISFTGHLAPRLDNPLDIRLHGQLVSRVESYKYLGVLIDSKLDHSAWLKQKRSALEHTISALHPVLANHQLTVNYRSRIFSAVVMGKAYYGFELVGGNKSHLAPLQTTINKGIRLFTGVRLSTAIGPLLVETGIGSLLTRSLVSRVRLLERSVTKRTPINAICSSTDNAVFTLNVQGQLVRSQRWFWSRRTKQLYKNRYWLTPQVRPKTVKQRHSFALMETLEHVETLHRSKTRKAIQIGILIDTHPFSADHCILCDQQLLSTSIAHLVVGCEQVTDHRIQSGLVPAIQKSRLRLLGRALDPSVENVYTWLRGGVLNGRSRSGPALVERDCGA
ncbi:hypothetical protein BASA50_000902 [Batrachochytrium salamandrivorans]|uniref:Translation initiation factor eIF2B subunit alpha n=1 Tax=Batrachochytrium salamandrivorans TaxID=1357716 RepID=A0ABQ8EVJ2_9FUNG|nr:hypothetical protein BASA50_000902 [Batrachochytrium salamandrivorans]